MRRHFLVMADLALRVRRRAGIHQPGGDSSGKGRESPEHHRGLLGCPWVQGRVPEPSWPEQSPAAALEQAVVWVMWSRD